MQANFLHLFNWDVWWRVPKIVYAYLFFIFRGAENRTRCCLYTATWRAIPLGYPFCAHAHFFFRFRPRRLDMRGRGTLFQLPEAVLLRPLYLYAANPCTVLPSSPEKSSRTVNLSYILAFLINFFKGSVSWDLRWVLLNFNRKLSLRPIIALA